MENLSGYVYVLFGLTVLLGLWLFARAAHYARSFLILIIAWIVIQSVLVIRGFYSDPATMTSRFPLLFLPALIFFAILFLVPQGKAFIDGLSLRMLTIFHVVRIPVEIVLFLLFANQIIPRAMSFEGRNFDILSGLSAPLIYYFCFIKNTVGRRGLLIWNIACVILLLNVVSSAALSLPGRFQQFGFERPNIALGYFPFFLLPVCLVPLALFANAAAIRQLLIRKGNNLSSQMTS